MTTVVAAFDSVRACEVARDSLLAHGVMPSRIQVQAASGSSSAQDVSSGRDATSGQDEGFFASVGDFFGRLFGDEAHDDTGKYSEAVRRGNAVLIVEAQSEQEAEELSDILEANGAYDIDERASEWRMAGSRESSTGATGVGTHLTAGQASENVLPVVQEELKVGKREVDAGKVRIVRRVTDNPVQEQVRLREERAVVERRPVDRPATDADLAGFREETIELEERREEAVVQKSARVVEEVKVGTDVSERTETINENLRRTDVDIERIPASSKQGDSLDEDEVDLAASSANSLSSGRPGRNPQ